MVIASARKISALVCNLVYPTTRVVYRSLPRADGGPCCAPHRFRDGCPPKTGYGVLLLANIHINKHGSLFVFEHSACLATKSFCSSQNCHCCLRVTECKVLPHPVRVTCASFAPMHRTTVPPTERHIHTECCCHCCLPTQVYCSKKLLWVVKRCHCRDSCRICARTTGYTT